MPYPKISWPRNSGPDIITKEMWFVNLPEMNPVHGYRVYGNVRGLSQAPSKIQDNRLSQENTAGVGRT